MRSVHQLFVFPREPAEEDGGVFALRFRENVLDRLVELSCFLAFNARFGLQPSPFVFQALANQIFLNPDLYKPCCPRRNTINWCGAHPSPRSLF